MQRMSAFDCRSVNMSNFAAPGMRVLYDLNFTREPPCALRIDRRTMCCSTWKDPVVITICGARRLQPNFDRHVSAANRSRWSRPAESWNVSTPMVISSFPSIRYSNSTPGWKCGVIFLLTATNENAPGTHSVSVHWHGSPDVSKDHGTEDDFGSDGNTLRSSRREMATTCRFRGSVKK